MQITNNIFEYIDFVLKKTKFNGSDVSFKNFYIFNRWLSMSNNDITKIVNATTNRWLLKNSNVDVLKFYRVILPKMNKKIFYIKKENKIKDTDPKDISTIANNYELSTREIQMYEETLDFLAPKIN
jgi:hypothetical protein